MARTDRCALCNGCQRDAIATAITDGQIELADWRAIVATLGSSATHPALLALQAHRNKPGDQAKAHR